MGPLLFFIFPGPFLPLFSPYSVKVLMDKSGAWMGVRAPRFFGMCPYAALAPFTQGSKTTLVQWFCLSRNIL